MNQPLGTRYMPTSKNFHAYGKLVNRYRPRERTVSPSPSRDENHADSHSLSYGSFTGSFTGADVFYLSLIHGEIKAYSKLIAG